MQEKECKHKHRTFDAKKCRWADQLQDRARINMKSIKRKDKKSTELKITSKHIFVWRDQ